MKYIITLILLTNVAFANENCSVSESDVDVQETKRVENVDTPKNLKGATITVVTKDNKTYTFSADEYMVAKRVKTTYIAAHTKNKVLTCNVAKDEQKNLLLLGARHDHTDISVRSDGKNATVSSEKDMVLDLSYYRKKIIKNVGAGIGIDTNGTPKGMLGVEF